MTSLPKSVSCSSVAQSNLQPFLTYWNKGRQNCLLFSANNTHNMRSNSTKRHKTAETARHNMQANTFTLMGRFSAHCHSSLMKQALITMHRLLAGHTGKHLPTLMMLADRKWLQGRLAVLTKESPSVVTVVLDLSDGLGESVTMAILAATASMTADGWWTSPCDHTVLSEV